MSDTAPELSIEVIIEAALRLAKRVGLDAITMRALADEMGVSHMATYYHVPNKNGLLQLVAEAAIAQVELAPPSAGVWHVRLSLLIRDMRAALVPYPGLGPFLLANEVPSPNSGRLMASAIAMLRESGFSERDALVAFTTVHNWLLGRLHVEAALSHSQLQRLDRRRGAAKVPAVRGVTAISRREYFDYGLEVVINGLRATVGRSVPE